MSNDPGPANPYSAPLETDFSIPTVDTNLADRSTRLIAAIMDGLIGLVVFLPIGFMTGYMQRSMSGTQPGMVELLTMTALGLVLFVVVHGYFLATAGQTVGKKLMGIRIVHYQTNEILPLAKVVGLRYLPLTIVQAIPVVNILGLVDALMIFKADRRCLHDMIASTKVVKA